MKSCNTVAAIGLTLLLAGNAHAIESDAAGPVLYRCSAPDAKAIDTSPAGSLWEAAVLYAVWAGVDTDTVRCVRVSH